MAGRGREGVGIKSSGRVDMAGVPEADEAPEGVGGIRSVLTMGSLVSPSGNEVLHLVASQ